MAGQTIILRGDSQRQLAKRLIDAAPVDAVVNVREMARTTIQSNKMWAMLSDISRAQPESLQGTTNVWKARFMHSCGHQVQFEHGIDGGAPFPVGFSSSRLSVSQMSNLIECIYEYGARHDIKWSDEVVAA